MKRKVLVSMGMCLMLFFSFATMTQAGYVNFDVTVAANGNHPSRTISQSFSSGIPSVPYVMLSRIVPENKMDC